MDADVVAEPLVEGAQGVLGELHFVAAHLGHAEPFEEVDGSGQAGRLDDRRRSGLELGGHRRRRVPVEPHVGDHVAAAEERRRGVEQLGSTPQQPDSRRAAHLVAGERDEVGVPCLHVGDVVRHVLAGVDDGERPGPMSSVGEQSHRGERAEHVAHRREGEDLGALQDVRRGR